MHSIFNSGQSSGHGSRFSPTAQPAESSGRGTRHLMIGSMWRKLLRNWGLFDTTTPLKVQCRYLLYSLSRLVHSFVGQVLTALMVESPPCTRGQLAVVDRRPV